MGCNGGRLCPEHIHKTIQDIFKHDFHFLQTCLAKMKIMLKNGCNQADESLYTNTCTR